MFRPLRYTLPCSGSFGGQGCKKERLDECLFPIMLPVTDGLGENAAGAFVGAKADMQTQRANTRFKR